MSQRSIVPIADRPSAYFWYASYDTGTETNQIDNFLKLQGNMSTGNDSSSNTDVGY